MKEEVLETEVAFERAAREEGLQHAFVTFADENAVICRKNKLIKGREEISKYFDEKQYKTGCMINWTPEYVDVTSSGEQAYTYGTYEMSIIDQNGVRQDIAGVFHTVWKRQEDNSWKYVWD